MATYIVSYDLNSPGQDYGRVTSFLENLDNWWHHLGSTWVVVTELSATQLRDEIKSRVDTNDKVLVVQSSNVGAWVGFSEKGSTWLKKNL